MTNSSFALDGDPGFAARSFLRSGGMSAESVRRRPVIGICTSWSELTPCNLPLRALAEAVKEGVAKAGGVAVEFPTISLSEALVSPTTMYLRNLMAMDVEEMITASPIDGVVLLNGCDKTVAAQLMGAVSADKPALSLGAGHRADGCFRGESVSIDDAWRFIDERRTGLIDDEEWLNLEGCLSPSAGVCNVLGTAITMGMIAEALGLALPGSSLAPAGSDERVELAKRTGATLVDLVSDGVRPSDVVTPESLKTAWRLLCTVGGSTNAVIHIQAIAGRAGIELDPDELSALARATPTLTRVRPNGPFSLGDLHHAGGVPAILSRLSGTTTAGGYHVMSDVIASVEAPVSPIGAIALLKGTLCPDGAVIKRSAASPALLSHRGPAVVFDGLQDLRKRIDTPELDVDAKSVLVLRGAGPLGAPGMPEAGAIPIPRKLYRAGVRDMVRISDARMSGTAAGTVVLHVAPESAADGPLGLVQDGDEIEIDVEQGRLDLCVSEDELRRRAELRREAGPSVRAPDRGYARLFQQNINQANEGCDFDFLRAKPRKEIEL